MIALGVLGLVGALNWRHTVRMEAAAALVARTHEVQANLNRLWSLLEGIGSGARGYVITGDPSYLESFDDGPLKVAEIQRRLGQLILDPGQKAGLEELSPIVDARIDLVRRVVAVRQSEGFAAAQREISRGAGEAAMDRIREQLDRMESAEQVLLEQRAAASRQQATITWWITATGTSLGLLLFCFVFALMVRENRLRRASEASLEASQRELKVAGRTNRLILENSLDVICTIDEAGRFGFVSAACLAVWGYRPEELIGRPYMDLVLSEDHPKTRAAAAEIVGGRPVANFENRYRHKDGRLVPVVWTARWSTEERLMFCVAHDLTEKKNAEAALEYERYLQRTLMENIPADVYFKDRLSRIVKNNRAHARRVGCADPAEAVGKTDHDFFSREHALQAQADEQEVMRTGRPLSKEEKETWPDGRVTWALTTKLPLHDEQGQVAGTFGISVDITDRKHAEESIRRLNDELAQRAAALESANKELEAFSYTVSHDLRAPLRHIGGFAAKLQRHLGDDKTDETSRRLLSTIASSARTMGLLIDDLLTFARLGRAELRRQRVDLGELVAESRRALAGEIGGRQIAWQIEPLPAVEGDPSLLRQVFANLLGNAVKYTGRCPAPRIEIGTQPGTSGEVVLYVRDNGAGFDMQYAGKLFGVFERLHAAGEFEGTGIGLATVRRIVERHGGRTWAEGAVGQGATFWLSLPGHAPPA